MIDLPPDLEAELAAEAARLRLPLPEYVVRVIAFGRPPNPKPQNGAELVAYWEAHGLIGTRPDITDPLPLMPASPLREKSDKRESWLRSRWELVDADVLIDIQRRHPPAVAWFGGLNQSARRSGLRRHGIDSGRPESA